MNYFRLLKHERGLIVSALVASGAAAGFGVPIDFVLFGLMLAGIAIFHHHTLQVALIGPTTSIAAGPSSRLTWTARTRTDLSARRSRVRPAQLSPNVTSPMWNRCAFGGNLGWM